MINIRGRLIFFIFSPSYFSHFPDTFFLFFTNWWMRQKRGKGRWFVNKNQSNKSNPRKSAWKEKQCSHFIWMRFIVRAHFFFYSFTDSCVGHMMTNRFAKENKHGVALVTEKESESLFRLKISFGNSVIFARGSFSTAPLMVQHRLIYDRKATTETRLYSSPYG